MMHAPAETLNSIIFEETERTPVSEQLTTDLAVLDNVFFKVDSTARMKMREIQHRIINQGPNKLFELSDALIENPNETTCINGYYIFAKFAEWMATEDEVELLSQTVNNQKVLQNPDGSTVDRLCFTIADIAISIRQRVTQRRDSEGEKKLETIAKELMQALDLEITNRHSPEDIYMAIASTGTQTALEFIENLDETAFPKKIEWQKIALNIDFAKETCSERQIFTRWENIQTQVYGYPNVYEYEQEELQTYSTTEKDEDEITSERIVEAQEYIADHFDTIPASIKPAAALLAYNYFKATIQSLEF